MVFGDWEIKCEQLARISEGDPTVEDHVAKSRFQRRLAMVHACWRHDDESALFASESKSGRVAHAAHEAEAARGVGGDDTFIVRAGLRS